MITTLFLIALTVSSVDADDWPHWRGLSRNGITNETSGFRSGDWNVEKDWKIVLGEGSSSPIVVDDKLYSFFYRDKKEWLVCLNAKDGRKIWEQSYEAPKYGRLAVGDQGLFSGPSSTPEYDLETNLIFTLGSDGLLSCFDAKRTGKRIWQISLYDSYDIPRRPKVGRSGLRDYGFTSSPLVFGDQLICEVGARQGCLISFDKMTGKQTWASQATAPAGHNGGPVPLTVQGVPCVAVHTHDGLLVVRMDRDHLGKTVATVPWVTSFSNNIASLAARGNRVVLTSAYNQNRIACFEIKLTGAQKIWEQKHASKICSPLIFEDKVYFSWRSHHCLDFATGKLEWKGGQTSDAGSLIATRDQRMIAWTGKGELSLFESYSQSPDKLEVLANIKVFSNTDAWPHVVLSNGRIFCQDRKGNLQCLTVKQD